MPVTLETAAPLLGTTTVSRKFTLVVTSHGRWEYLKRTLVALHESVGLGFFDRLVLSLDGSWGAVPDRHAEQIEAFRFELVDTGYRQGLTANLSQAWGALTSADDYVLHVEEDFLIHDAPLEAMADTLDAYRHVANMVLVRQPWNAQEIQAGSVLKANRHTLTPRDGWIEHRNGFWLNPFVAHSSLLRSLCPGVEKALTEQCAARRLVYGYWGGMDDEPRCTHIGAEGGMGSPGWKP